MTTEARGHGTGDRDGRESRGRPAAGDRRRGAPSDGAVPRVLRGADREREDAGGVRAGGGAIPRVVRGARPRAARCLAAPRRRLHPEALGGRGVGQGLGQFVALGLVLGLKSAQLLEVRRHTVAVETGDPAGGARGIVGTVNIEIVTERPLMH